MPDLRHVLEARREALRPEAGGFERLTRRRRRRETRRRVAAGTLALALMAGGLLVAASVWRGAQRLPEEPVPIDRSTVSSLVVAWTARVQGEPSTPSVADGMVFVSADRLYAFPASCGSGGSACPPLWVGNVGGDQPLTAPTVLDGVVYVGADRLYAFDERCGVDGSTCVPLWTSSASGNPSIGLSAPVAGHGHVYVSQGGDLYAFNPRCGATVCAPTWTGAGVGSDSSRVALGRWVYVRLHGSLSAFPFDCPTRRCGPRWNVPSSDEYPDQPIVAGGGELYVGPDAFEANCGEGGGCSPSWVAGVDAPTAEDLGANMIGGTAVVDGVVFMTASRLYAFPARCASDGSTCPPLWVGPRQASAVITGFQSWSTPTVSHGLVFTATDRVSVFDSMCATHGAACQPIWVGPAVSGTIMTGVAVTSGRVFVGSSDGTVWGYQTSPA
jgi:PQQ-like domain